jgi:tetratricopeptide (TPR) repeat protein
MTGHSRDANAVFQTGFTFHQQGNLTEAEDIYSSVLLMAPDHFDAAHLLGMIFLQTGRTERGVDQISWAVGLNPAFASAHSNLAVGLMTLGRLDEALASLERAIELDGRFADAHYNRGKVLHDLQRPGEAIISYDRAIALDPAYAAAHLNRGDALRICGRVDEALASCDQAIALAPDLAEAHNNRASALHELMRLDEALISYERAISLKADCAEAHTNRAFALLLAGRYEEGWRALEWRWRGGYQKDGDRGFSQPLWLGEPLGERTLLLHAEQGLGDTLQFCRYVPLITGGAKIVLEAQPALVRLMRSLPGDAQVVASGDPLPPFDLHCPLLSLPLALGTQLDMIPANTPYLSADLAGATRWRGRLAGLEGLKVGIVWAGESRKGVAGLAAIDARRSITLAAMARLGEVTGVSLVSLQKGEPARQAADPPTGMALVDHTAELTDFADTAALIDGLDLVISVDTSVVHLAGAMGKPVWLLNRYDTCWRWLIGRDDSPWYPSLRQFRQPAPGDWASVIEKVRHALATLAAAGRGRQAPEHGATG